MWVIKLDGFLWNSRRLPDWLGQIACFGSGEVVLVPGSGPVMDQTRCCGSLWELADAASFLP
ncbi:MAG TPA: hypothetical protein VKA48_08325 [Gammaproteobacteria bacterium]|nr:hypothetical protein [Gammaproteobacteria bacterium]